VSSVKNINDLEEFVLFFWGWGEWAGKIKSWNLRQSFQNFVSQLWITAFV
jgi:hypothetical protein